MEQESFIRTANVNAELVFDYTETPLGELEVCACDLGLVSLLFTETKKGKLTRHATGKHAVISETGQQLAAYFRSELKAFRVPLFMKGTDFQNRVWNELQKIPFGGTVSYLQLARQLGDEKCIRAAASANGKNPFAVIVPCHRVIGSDGTLTGYAGDLWRKQWLLEHEAKATGVYQKLF
jgi:methylated-DNA-[protein]-cysteine S-methyltransferase